MRFKMYVIANNFPQLTVMVLILVKKKVFVSFSILKCLIVHMDSINGVLIGNHII